MMAGKITIELKQVFFYSYHGLYDEERKVGGEFVVDLAVKYTVAERKVQRINETVNYEKLYDLVKQEMDEPRDLLETVAMDITENIRKQFPSVEEAEIRIVKKSPPIINFSGSVTVTYKRIF
jgi:dihydroneopterin aldolase